MAPSMSLFSINAIIILNSDDGSRVFTKYYQPPHQQSAGRKLLPLHPPNFSPLSTHTNLQSPDSNAPTPPYTDLKSQKAFEKGLLEKTAKQTADIILYDNRIVLYKSESDVMMYVVGGVDENEIMLYNVVLCLRDSLHLLFKYVPFNSSPKPEPLPILN
jgi:hypothetical protein